MGVEESCDGMFLFCQPPRLLVTDVVRWYLVTYSPKTEDDGNCLIEPFNMRV